MKSLYKWELLLLLSLAFFFHQADRVLFGLLTIPIQEDLGLNDLQIGLVNTSLFCTLAVMTPLAGFLGDRFSRKWIITASLLFWSLMTACTGFVGGLAGLIFFRSIATGGGEAFYAPSAYALLAAHHTNTRSFALSIHQAALYIGLMSSGALVAWVLRQLQQTECVIRLFGRLGYWRPVFILFGGVGFLLGIVFVFHLRDRAGAAPAATHGRMFHAIGQSVKALAMNRSALLAASGFIAIVFANNAFLSWGPKFMSRKFGLSVGEAGNGTMFYHHICALIAILIGGVLTDRLVKRNPRFRLGLQIVALFCGAPMLWLIGCSQTVIGTWVAIAAYGVFRGLFEVNTHASLFDVVEPRYRSTAVGLMNMAAFFIGSLSPLLIGVLSNRYTLAGLRAAGLSASQAAAVVANPAASASLLGQFHLTAEAVNRMGVPGFEAGFTWMGAAYLLGGVLMLGSFFFTFKRDRIQEATPLA